MIDDDDTGSGSGTGRGGKIGSAEWAGNMTRARELAAEVGGELERSSKSGREFASIMTNAFEGIAFKGKSASDVLKSFALSLSQLALKSALKPLEQGLGSLFDGLLKGGFGFAKGAAFQQSAPVPFATGGVISSPIGFPLAGGRMGLAGEAGAEAIMPLRRGADGRLGVAAVGAGNGPQITINVSTPDAESFRRSETQVAAMIARAASLGQRNL